MLDTNAEQYRKLATRPLTALDVLTDFGRRSNIVAANLIQQPTVADA